jgi:hypothetical protein
MTSGDLDMLTIGDVVSYDNSAALLALTNVLVMLG